MSELIGDQIEDEGYWVSEGQIVSTSYISLNENPQNPGIGERLRNNMAQLVRDNPEVASYISFLGVIQPDELQ